MLALVTAYDLSMQGLVFTNNSNVWSESSVCLDVSMAVPAVVEVKNSVFTGNKAVYGTLAKVAGAKGLSLSFIEASGNIAISTSAGIIFTPLVNMDSYITVVNCLFTNNTAMRSGILLVSETSGNMLFGSSHATITIKNTTFSYNRSQYGGCSLSITGTIVLSQDSLISENKYLNNECTEGGGGLYVTYIAGAISLENNLFEGNNGQFGSAIYSTHQGAKDGKTYLSVSNCIFRGNKGDKTVRIEGADLPLLFTSNNTFEGNEGSCISLSAAQWHDSSSSYVLNHAQESCVFAASDFSTISLQNLTAESNSVSIKGGVASVSMHSIVSCNSCFFHNNSCAEIGGALSIDQQSEFTCVQCEFKENSAGNVGSVIYAIFSVIKLTNSSIYGNYAGEYGLIALVESSLDLYFSEITNNSATIRSPGIISSMSNVTIRSTSLHDQTGYTGTFLFGAVSNQILVENSQFFNGAAVSGALFYIAINSTLTAVNSQFHDCYAKSDGSIVQARTVTLNFTNITVWNMACPKSSGAIYSIFSTITISNADFRDMTGSVILAQTSYITLNGVLVSRTVAALGSGVSCVDCYFVSVSNSLFSMNTAKLGGAVYTYTSGFLGDTLTATYQNNTFSSNIAINGGAVYSNSVLLEVRRNRFENNTATSAIEGSNGMLVVGVGGGIYGVCEFVSNCYFKIVGNAFEGNKAEKKGGGVYWFDSYPLISDNTMKDNSAVYGADIASFAIRLAPFDSQSGLLEYQTNDTVPLAGSMKDVASGHISNEILQFALVDHYDKVISDDSESAAQLVTIDGNLSIAGSTQAIATNGVFTFSKLVFKAQPDTHQSFKVTTPTITFALQAYIFDPNKYVPTVEITAAFRTCQMGESLQSQECYLCPEGTFSLDPAQPCNSCPNHVICYGNFTMVPDSGYWRPDPLLNVFFACPNPDACLGSPISEPTSLTGLCATGYSGNLCSVCEADYSANGRNECSKCPSLTANVIVSLLIVTTALALGACAIVISIRGASRPRSGLAIHLKIFMNYLQMVVVAASLNMNWPAFVSMFLNGQDTAGSVTEQLFSFDCILQKMDVNSVFYTKMEGNAVLPAVLLLFAGVVWSFISLCLRITQIFPKIIASLVMIVFILHPSLTKEMFSMFSCTELKPGELWLAADLSLRCWSWEHIKYALMVSLSSIAVWIIGLPLLCLCLIYRTRNTLADPVTQIKFSFLYKGYQPRWYFWEFVILYRKVALVCASVFLSTVSIMVQALSVLAVLLISLFFQLQLQPFATAVFNRLELKSILVSAVTIYSGLFYQTEDIGKVLVSN